ncbi:hypothetical protein NITGR_1040013 [Nitrospina gracilis 3/211]|uniref:Uncharacterized protein n=1 Tax=Nitrospina gracilis (strain 3/211) TaxID=1266370 RepID=M1YUX4_NITG3|nr:hypothetical protein NITGR_1040013 [Nitrospina gracilis 3/211]
MPLQKGVLYKTNVSGTLPHRVLTLAYLTQIRTRNRLFYKKLWIKAALHEDAHHHQSSLLDSKFIIFWEGAQFYEHSSIARPYSGATHSGERSPKRGDHHSRFRQGCAHGRPSEGRRPGPDR